MKITFITSSLVGGGAERVVSELAASLSQNRHTVSIITTSSDSKDYQLDESVKHIQLSDESVWQLYLRMKEEKSDIYISFLHYPNIYTLLANLLLRKKVIITERNSPESELNLIFKSNRHVKIKHFLMRKLYGLADGMVFQTEQQLEFYGEKMFGKSVVIPNPIMRNLPDVYMGKRQKRIVAVGAFRTQKNYPLLIRAFNRFHKKFPEYTLYIYGKGPEKSKVGVLVNQLYLKDCVKFRGFQKDVHNEIKDAVFYVLSSNYEGIPNALSEAMALGLPVIATDCPGGGPRLLIRNGKNGILVPVGNDMALATAMIKLASNEVLRDTFNREAPKVRDVYRSDKITAKWESFIYQVIGASARK